ncbi:MAG: hypothetical protein J0I49_16355 [Pseudonocardia sp.]|uniref:hypothetical protein n=1 Tax=Pseudonocardia sp. TaxID=60912 RepID=UPI001AD0D44E|nr:hypothetical protein [Pseudonocardia sp.]MBN9099666.1 hypothetical protein [Pseudonocardia sp.]
MLTPLLHAHLERYGTGGDGLLFRGVGGGQFAESTYGRSSGRRSAPTQHPMSRNVDT